MNQIQILTINVNVDLQHQVVSKLMQLQTRTDTTYALCVNFMDSVQRTFRKFSLPDATPIIGITSALGVSQNNDATHM
jgi:hypothetical protein